MKKDPSGLLLVVSVLLLLIAAVLDFTRGDYEFELEYGSETKDD